jgi:hypothetical protein
VTSIVVGGHEGEAKLAVREHVGAVGEAHRELGALLDEQDRDAPRADLGQR